MSATVTATFVFTDLVDSTATAARLGPERAEELRQTHFRLLRGAVTASGGDEVKNLGDGLMIMYSSPSRAVAGAVGMQQAIEHHNRADGERLLIRVGIATGEAVEEEADYFGEPVIEAARLCAHAQGGQILATNLVRLMLGRNATQPFADLGAVALKGLPEPVETVEVVWEPAVVAGATPLPGRLVGAATDALFGFFGRVEELARIDEVRKVAHTSQRVQAVFVAGEAGIGKTAFVAHEARAAHAEGATVMFGHSDEDIGIAYQPWIEALSELVRHGGPELAERLPAAQRAALARFVPSLAVDTPVAVDADTERMLLFEGVRDLLAAAAERAPVFLVLDDAHWADAASVQLLRHVIVTAAPLDVTVVCTVRDTDLARGDPLNMLLADLHREANVVRIRLKGLDDVELAELIAAAAGHDLDDEGFGLAHALRRETDGNPFFTAEVLRHLFEAGHIAQNDEGRWIVVGGLDSVGLPTSVRDVVSRRVERLGDEARRVLSCAAVIGRDFDVQLLAAVTEVDEDRLLDLIDAAVASAVLVEEAESDRYRFAHALTQRTLHDDISAARRQRVHQRVAVALEAQSNTSDAGALAELARHFIAATRPVDAAKAIEYARRAGDAARDALAPDDALGWYQQALDLLDRQQPADEHQRAQLLAVLGTVQRRAGHAKATESLLRAAELAERLGDTEALVEAALGFTIQTGAQPGDEEAIRVIASALDRVGHDSPPTRARLLAALAAAQDAAREWQSRLELSIAAVEAARHGGDDHVFAAVVESTNEVLATPDRLTESVADTEDAVAVADRVGDAFLQADLRYHLLWGRYQQCDVGGAATVGSQMKQITQEIGLPYQRWRLALFETGRLLLAGYADQAETVNEGALELGTAADTPDALGAFGGMLFVIRAQQGRIDEIADFFLDVARDSPSIATLRVMVPMLLADLGRTDEAREKLAAETAMDFDVPYDITWLTSMGVLLDAAAAVTDVVAARALIQRVAPFADHVLAPTATNVAGALARPLARAATVLGEYDQAEVWLSIAHNIHARLEAPYWTARGQLDHADLCLARRADGDVERARELITTAAATAADYGCAGLTKRATTLLADL
jgi:class 3 adenylate cyclase/tetratricopeptide (TPR) repeat protein